MGNSHAIWDHTVLPATRQRWESRLYTQPQQVLDLATPRGMQGWVDLCYVKALIVRNICGCLHFQPPNMTTHLPVSSYITWWWTDKVWTVCPECVCVCLCVCMCVSLISDHCTLYSLPAVKNFQIYLRLAYPYQLPVCKKTRYGHDSVPYWISRQF